ncbi:MAG: hypothetical protein H6774_00435 [Pseudomonadales bacterium]|nr:hypothetical protein [Candidatus Woesebacteria bacterium]MCB9801539.1 hypothetical protein [Pseudomonadales bacterium]
MKRVTFFTLHLAVCLSVVSLGVVPFASAQSISPLPSVSPSPSASLSPSPSVSPTPAGITGSASATPTATMTATTTKGGVTYPEQLPQSGTGVMTLLVAGFGLACMIAGGYVLYALPEVLEDDAR